MPLALLLGMGCAPAEPNASSPARNEESPAVPTADLDQVAPPTTELSNVVTEPPPSDRAEPPPDAPSSVSEPVATASDVVAQVPEKLPASTVSQSSVPKSGPGDKESLFVDWPKPEFVLVFSGQQNGYIEPCGCTGLANQKGGLMRRDTFLKDLKKRGWDVIPLDVGNQIHRFGKQQEIKFQRSAEALRKMDYQGVVFGVDDLRLPTLEVFSGTNDGGDHNVFVCANVALLDRSQTPEYHIVQAGGKKIGVTGVLGDSFRAKLTGDEIVHLPAAEGLKSATDKLLEEKCDLYILLAHATLDETADLSKKFPQYKIVATAGGVGEPPIGLERMPGTEAQFVQVGSKGMYVMAVGVFDNKETPFRTQRVPLDSRFEDSPAMLHLMEEYQEQLKALGLEGLGLKPQPHPSENTYVGTEKCGECHTKAYEIWKNTPHAHATDSIVTPAERSSIPRHFDPECLSCHVTGWEPQKMFPIASGYLGLDQTPHMTQNGCENCHGPGSRHVAAESGDITAGEELLKKLRDQMKLPLANEVAQRKCMECHDIDNSPDFHDPGAFEKYWKQVEHKGKD